MNLINADQKHTHLILETVNSGWKHDDYFLILIPEVIGNFRMYKTNSHMILKTYRLAIISSVYPYLFRLHKEVYVNVPLCNPRDWYSTSQTCF